ncbi:MAG: XRE family transcriptional regulator [Propionibacteriales bacterium]|nr:XRE family transcriptional regulator [Propionibacteriales bacterium]
MTTKLRAARDRAGLKQSQVIAELTRRAATAGLAIALPASLKTMLSQFGNEHRPVNEPYRGLFRSIYGLTDEELFGAEPVASSEQQSEYDLFAERISSARAVGPETAEVFAQQTDALRAADCHLGVAPLLDQMATHLSTLENALSHAIVPSVRRPLAAVLADAAAIAAWQALDIGVINRAWSYHEKARAAALEAQDVVLLTHAMAQQAMVLLEVGDVASARELAQVALDEAGTKVPERFRAWLHAAEAEVCSVADDASACRRGFDVARELVPAGDDAVEPGMPFIILNASHLARWQGNALARLGDPDAVDHLYRALDGNGAITSRAKAGLHCDLATAHLQRGERDDASEHASRARKLARQAGSIRQQRRVDKLLIVA